MHVVWDMHSTRASRPIQKSLWQSTLIADFGLPVPAPGLDPRASQGPNHSRIIGGGLNSNNHYGVDGAVPIVSSGYPWTSSRSSL